jgi:hypothetical protein
MTALAAPRPTPTLETGKTVWRTFPVAADVIIYPGAQVALNGAGNLVPATSSAALTVVGIAVPKRQQMKRFAGYVDSTGLAAAALECEVQSCIALMKNSASTDLITKAEVGDDCYMVDDQTVAKTDGGVAQVTVFTVVYDAGAATGLTFTGVSLVTVTAATSATATALALSNKLNDNGSFALLYTAVPSGADITVTKKTSGTFTGTKTVSGAADITQVTNPAGVAPTRSRAGKVHDIDTRGVWVDHAA